jgi:hypothetical protein
MERRDLLMSGRRVAGASPPSTNGRPAAPSTERNSHPSHPANERPSSGSVGASGTAKPSPWEGEGGNGLGSGLGSVALPRREPVSSRLGRGLWAFDARG